MRFEFSKNTLNFLKLIAECAQEHNVRLFFVGGMVRDNLLNEKIKDIDLLVEYNALDFIKFLPPEIKVKSLHSDFSTAKIEFEGEIIDVTSTRIEHYPYSGCLPVVDLVGVSINEDYKRRDFTINAMYCELILKGKNIDFNLIDLSEGVNDLKNKTLRVLHNNSYIDDPTRIIRGVNFENRFGLDFSPEDKILISSYLKNPNIENASTDRIIAVFNYVLSSKCADKNFIDIIQNKYYKIINNGELNCDFSKIQDIIRRFKINSKAQFYLEIILNKDIAPYKLNNELDIKNTFSKLKDYELGYYFLKTNDENALKYLTLRDIELNIKGYDLIKNGYKEGKTIGIVLDNLLQNKLKTPEKFINKELELDWAIKNFPPST